MKKQILADGTTVLEGSPEEIRLLENGPEVNDGYVDDEDIFDHLHSVEGSDMRSFVMGHRGGFGRDGRRSWMDSRDERIHFGGTNGNPRTPEALLEEIRYLKEDRANDADQIARHYTTQDALRKEARRVADKWQFEEAKVGKLERQLAKAVEQGFDPDKKSEFKTEIVTENGTTIYFKVLKSGTHAGKVAQYYHGGSYLHNGDPVWSNYLENYVAAGVDVDDRVHPYPTSGYSLLADSEMPNAVGTNEELIKA